MTLLTTLHAVLLPGSIFLGVAGLIGVIWAGIVGAWGLIGYALLAGLAGPLALGFAMMPGGIIFGGPAVVFAEQNKKALSLIFGSLALIYSYGIMSAFSITAFVYFNLKASDESFVPAMLIASSIGGATVAFLQSKEPDGNPYNQLASGWVATASLISFIGIVFGEFHLQHIVGTFAVMVLLSTLVNLFVMSGELPDS